MKEQIDCIPYEELQKRFVFFANDARFHYYPDYTVLNIINASLNRFSLFLNETATEILEMCDGRTRVEAITDRFQQQHQAPLPRVKNSVTSLLNGGLKGKYLRTSDLPCDQNIVKTGSKLYYIPQKMSLELTARCNLRCLHCYGGFSNFQEASIEFPKLTAILQYLIDAGLKVVTITGGEPFLYKNIVDFLLWLFPKVEAVGIISNGTHIPEDAFNILERNTGKTVFQTSINGLKPYHDHFTGLPGSFDKVIANIRKLVERGIRLRLTMNMNSENLNHIQDVANLAHELNVFAMSISVAHNIGREKTRRLSDQYFEGKDRDNNVEMINLVLNEMEKARQRFPDLFKRRDELKSIMSIGQSYPSSQEETMERPYTCGAGQRSFHLDAKGNVQLCAISAACGFPPLGNLLLNSLEEVMTAPVARLVSKLPAPMQAFCDTHCKHFAFCGGCTARGFAKFQEEGANCTWARRFLSIENRQSIVNAKRLN